jgi:hypothetical protein
MAKKGPVKRTIQGPDVLSSVILDTSNAERSLNNFITKVNKSSKKLEIEVGIDALKHAKTIWDAMRSELSQHGETEIFRGLAETFDTAEKAFRNMKATLNGEEIRGFAKIIQSLSSADLDNVSKLDLGMPGLKNNIMEVKKLQEATEAAMKSEQKLSKTRKKTAEENEADAAARIRRQITKIKRQVSNVSNANLEFRIDTGDLNNIDASTEKLKKWAAQLVSCRDELNELKKSGVEGMEDILEEVNNAIENSLENINNKIINATEMLRSAGAHNPNVSIDIGVNAAKLKKQADATRELADANEKLNNSIEKSLKLSRVKGENGRNVPQTYSAVNGKYLIEKGTVGWNMYDNTGSGHGELIATYETLKELREDSYLIAEQEAKAQERLAATQETVGDPIEIGKQAQAIENATKAQIDFNEAKNAAWDKQDSLTAEYEAVGAELDALERKYNNVLSLVEDWRQLNGDLGKVSGKNSTDLRKNLIKMLSGIKPELALLIGDSFTNALSNGFKGIKTKDIATMVSRIDGMNLLGGVDEVLSILDNIDFNDIDVPLIESIKGRFDFSDDAIKFLDEIVQKRQQQLEITQKISEAQWELFDAMSAETIHANSLLTKDDLAPAIEDTTKARNEDAQAAEKQGRTLEQVNSELDKEKEKLAQIEEQQKRNEIAREQFKKKQANYGKEVLDVDSAVYDTDILHGAADALKELNIMAAKRNELEAEYLKLKEIISKYYIGQYSMSNGLYNSFEDYMNQIPEMQRLFDLFETKGIKNVKATVYPTADIKSDLRFIETDIRASGQAISELLFDGSVVGDRITHNLNEEEVALGKEQQRLHEEYQDQLTKVNDLKSESLELTRQIGQAEKKNNQQLPSTGDSTRSIESQVKSIEDTYDEAYANVNRLREQLRQAREEQEKLCEETELYGYTTGMSALRAGKARKTLSMDSENNDYWSRSEFIEYQMSKGFAPHIFSGDRHVLSDGGTSYELKTKEEFEYAKYLENQIKNLNVVFEKGLEMLWDPDGLLKAAEDKVTSLTNQLEQAEKAKEDAYERMSYAHAGFVTDESFIAEKQRIESENASKYQTPVMEEQVPAAESIVQLVDDYGSKLDEVNNKLMQGTSLLNEQGEVLRLFHNSPDIFDAFDISKAGSNQGQALGLGNYLALRQNGEFNDLTYGRYQTQWYANVQNPFKAGGELTSEQAASIIDKFLEGRADGFKNHMLSKLLDGDVITAIKDIAEIAKTNVGEVFGHIGYDAVMDGAQINVFDPSKIHRANESVLDIGTKEFEDFRELQKQIWDERSIIADANRRIEELSNQYSGKTEDQLNFDLFMETMSKGWGWHKNVAKIGSAFKKLTGKLPESDDVSAESMRALVENYEFSKQQISLWQEHISKHTPILEGLTSQFEAQKKSIDAKTLSYLTDNISGIVNPEVPVVPVIETSSVQEEIVESVGDKPVEIPVEPVVQKPEITEDIVPKIEEAVQAEQKLLDTTQQVEQAMEKQAAAASKAADEIERLEDLEEDLDDVIDDVPVDGDDQEEKLRIIQKTVDDALAQLNKADPNKNSMIDLSNLESEADLTKRIGEFVKNASNADLSVGDVVLVDDIAKIGLYNEKLGITTQQIWQLKRATEEATEANLEFIKADPLKIDFKKAQKYADNQKKLGDRSNSWITSQLGVLDTKERAYKYSNKKISGDTKIENFDGTAEQYIGQTIDGLADSIRQRLLHATDGVITEEFKNSILNDMRILENEIKIQQYKEYASTTMTPTEIGEARKQFEYMLDALESKAKKNNVFDDVSDSLNTLRAQATNPEVEGYLTDGQAVSGFVDKLRTAKAELNAAIADEGVIKKEQSNLQTALNLQEKLYTAKKKLAKLEVQGKTDTAAGMEAQRKVDEADEEYKAVEKLIKAEESRAKLNAQRDKMQDELAKVAEEEAKIKFEANDEVAKNESAQHIKDTYDSILNTVNKINSIDKDLMDLGSKNEFGVYDKLIMQLKAEKEQLVAQLRDTLSAAGDTYGNGIVRGDQTVSGARYFSQDDINNLNAFIQGIGLGTDEVNKLNAAFMQSDKIGSDAMNKIVASMSNVQSAARGIFELDSNGLVAGTKDGMAMGSAAFSQAYNAYLEYQQEMRNLSQQDVIGANTSALDEAEKKFLKYAQTLGLVIQKEKEYFAGRRKYTSGDKFTMNDIVPVDDDSTRKINEKYEKEKKLIEMAKKFATDSNAGGAVITNFVQGADGISKLDFSILDKGADSVRKFRMEMDSAGNIYKPIETSVNSFVSQQKIAEQQMERMSELIKNSKDIGFGGASFDKLVAARDKLRTAQVAGDDSALKQYITEAKIVTAEVEKLYQKHMQFQQAIETGSATASNIDVNGDIYKQMVASAKEYINVNEGVNAQIGKLNPTTNQLKFSFETADGTLREFTMSLDAFGKRCVTTQGPITQLKSKWGQFTDGISKTGKQMLGAFVGMNVFYKSFAEIRKGYQYVKEIDLAMTELKKVTDETSVAYDNFLDTASKRAATIGTTVSNFTEATANFARLGYDMDQAAVMAESAIVYKNVADGLDTVEESTDSIISTMKAFGIESNNTMSIVDKFNAVGKLLPRLYSNI